MKKNFLIMLLTVFCVSFAFAQTTVETVNGFVPGAGTGNNNTHQTYAVVGQVFGIIAVENDFEVAAGHAQMQIVADTLLPIIVNCGDAINVPPFVLSADSVKKLFANGKHLDTFLVKQYPNEATYNYDTAVVLHVLGCNCEIADNENHLYEVLLVEDVCWTTPNLQSTKDCNGEDIEYKQYSNEVTSALDPATFGYLYTWAAATKNTTCDSVYVQGICPCGWHIPTAAEMQTWISQNTPALRANNPDNWIAGESTNTTGFSAQPAGYFNSNANRFEGYTTEADFWYVGDNCTPSAMQILYYCNVPMTLPRNANDALSVRCAKDLRYDAALTGASADNNRPGVNPDPTLPY